MPPLSTVGIPGIHAGEDVKDASHALPASAGTSQRPLPSVTGLPYPIK